MLIRNLRLIDGAGDIRPDGVDVRIHDAVRALRRMMGTGRTRGTLHAIRNLRLIDGAGDIRDGSTARGASPDRPRPRRGRGDGGATAIPGLIDAHTHLTLDATPDALDNAIDLPLVDQAGATARRAAALLGHGVTTAREVGGVAALSLELRDSIASGSTPGPRVFTAGAWMTGPDGHGWHVGLHAMGPEGVRQRRTRSNSTTARTCSSSWSRAA